MAVSGLQVNVVAREIVAVLTKGTLCDPEMLAGQADPNYVMALHQSAAVSASGCTDFGTCLVDVATGQMIIGQWYANSDYHLPT
jgi:DNA mismatch repair protein MSH6